MKVGLVAHLRQRRGDTPMNPGAVQAAMDRRKVVRRMIKIIGSGWTPAKVQREALGQLSRTEVRDALMHLGYRVSGGGWAREPVRRELPKPKRMRFFE